MKDITLLTRREALKKTLLFSTGILAASRFNSSAGEKAVTDFSSKGLHFLAIGDFGSGNGHQVAVASQMATFAQKLNAPMSAVLALGDNFYGKLEPERFGRHFEEMYSKEHLNCPFYAVLGNHDYGPSYDSKQGAAKAQIQLDYTKDNPSSRWKMPAKWYALELPDAQNPLVKIVFLDGNMYEGMLTPQEKLAQQRFLEAELKKETRAPWRWMISHYPIFSECVKRGDSSRLIKSLGEHLKSYPISLYLAGHDHNLQHLEVEGYNSSFIISGAGGASLYDVKPATRGYAQKILGFTHIHLTPDNIDVQFISSEGDRLHAFRRTHAGKVKTIT
jgi:tartrate-resistant acid phosphatase type 5